MTRTRKFARTLAAALAAVALTLTAASLKAETDPDVGGAAMYPTKNIVENAVNSQDHTTLVAAVKAAGLVDTLEGLAPLPSSRRSTRPLTNCPPAPWIRCSSRRTRINW